MFILFRLFVFFQVVQKQTFGEVGPWELEQSFDVKYSILNVCTKNKILFKRTWSLSIASR